MLAEQTGDVCRRTSVWLMEISQLNKLQSDVCQGASLFLCKLTRKVNSLGGKPQAALG